MQVTPYSLRDLPLPKKRPIEPWRWTWTAIADMQFDARSEYLMSCHNTGYFSRFTVQP